MRIAKLANVIAPADAGLDALRPGSVGLAQHYRPVPPMHPNDETAD